MSKDFYLCTPRPQFKSKTDKELIQTINTYNDLILRERKAWEFFNKYTDYDKTNPKEYKIAEKKIEGIISEIGELDWINQYSNKFKTNEDGTLSYIQPILQDQVKLF